MVIFVDETPDLLKNKFKYFILGSYTTSDRKRIINAFRRFQRRKFPQKLRFDTEIKFANPSIDDNLRLRFLKHLVSQDIRIFYVYLQKKNFPLEYRRGKKLQTGLLYAQIMGDLLELYLPTTDKIMQVYRDPRGLKGLTKKEFNEILETRLLPQLPAGAKFFMDILDSSHPEIQVADWICGALRKYHEKDNLSEDFYVVLKNNIIESKELFKEYWTQKWIRKTNKKG